VTPRAVSNDAVLASLAPGSRIYVPGSTGEPRAVLDALARDPERLPGLDVVTTAVPGINRFGPDDVAPSATVTGLFMQPGFRAAQAEGRFRHLPLPFSGFVDHLAATAPFDACLVQVAPPDAAGRCSLGAAVEFTPLALARSRRRVAVLNPAMPAIPGAASVTLDDFDLVTEADTPLPTYEPGPGSREAATIAAFVATLVEDGAALQAGLGKVPEALFGLLHDRRALRLHSGMLSDGALALAEAGALDPDFDHASCVWVGSAALYRALHGRTGFTVAGCEVTHDLRRLAGIDRFVAVNSALAVDLFGQANLEHAQGRAVSGVGGAADFALGARLSRGGISVVALPAAFGREPRSRIVPRLEDGIASLPRHAVDVVVTEHGLADLRGRSVHERAEALISIAAPAFRADLLTAWHAIRDRL